MAAVGDFNPTYSVRYYRNRPGRGGENAKNCLCPTSRSSSSCILHAPTSRLSSRLLLSEHCIETRDGVEQTRNHGQLLVTDNDDSRTCSRHRRDFQNYAAACRANVSGNRRWNDLFAVLWEFSERCGAGFLPPRGLEGFPASVFIVPSS